MPDIDELRWLPQDYYFVVYRNGDGPDETEFGIVQKWFWDQHGCLSDCFDDQIDDLMPDGFDLAAESTYQYVGSVGMGIKKLLAAGFTRAYNEGDPDAPYPIGEF